MTVSPKKRLKLFNRVMNEFTTEYNTLYHKNIRYKAKEISCLDNFRISVDSVRDSFLNCEPECIEKIPLLVKLEVKEHCSKNVWKYLHNLYFISLEERKPELVEVSKNSLVKVNNSSSVSQDELGKMISSMSDIIMPLVKDMDLNKISKDLDMNSVMSGLMKGNQNIGGVDFSSIISSTTKHIEDKIANGEIDVSKFQDLLKVKNSE